MRNYFDFGQLRVNFSSKMSSENIRNDCCHAWFSRKIKTFIEINERKKKRSEKENSRIYEEESS